MKILLWQDQNSIYQNLVEIVKVLATVEGSEATDAICDAYQIASLVGGKKMLKAMEGKHDY